MYGSKLTEGEGNAVAFVAVVVSWNFWGGDASFVVANDRNRNKSERYCLGQVHDNCGRSRPRLVTTATAKDFCVAPGDKRPRLRRENLLNKKRQRFSSSATRRQCDREIRGWFRRGSGVWATAQISWSLGFWGKFVGGTRTKTRVGEGNTPRPGGGGPSSARRLGLSAYALGECHLIDHRKLVNAISSFEMHFSRVF